MVGLLVNEILRPVEKPQRIHDAVAITALRACLRGSAPGGPEAVELFGRLQAIAERDDVETRVFRDALNQLLELSAQQQGASDSEHSEDSRFLSYLSVLVS